MRMWLEAGKGDAMVRLRLDLLSALDGAALVVGGIDLSPGMAIPSDGDPRIDRALQGFLFTCGPDHIRHPEPTATGHRYPLHGSLCGCPVEPQRLDVGRGGCTASMDIPLADGGRSRLTRRWSVLDSAPGLELRDRIENIGDAPFAPMWMYHLNLAGRLFDDGTRMTGAMIPAGAQHWRFEDGDSAHVCLPAGSDYGWAEVCVGPFAVLGGRSLRIRFATDSLPFLQMWRCQRGAADVVSIEPVSHRIARRTALSETGELPLLAPGETADYALSFSVIGGEDEDEARRAP